jgi:hypothetical protein
LYIEVALSQFSTKCLAQGIYNPIHRFRMLFGIGSVAKRMISSFLVRDKATFMRFLLRKMVGFLTRLKITKSASCPWH